MEATMTVKEFAKELGVSSETIRRWDRSGKLPARRRANGYRYYTREDLALANSWSPNKFFMPGIRAVIPTVSRHLAQQAMAEPQDHPYMKVLLDSEIRWLEMFFCLGDGQAAVAHLAGARAARASELFGVSPEPSLAVDAILEHVQNSKVIPEHLKSRALLDSLGTKDSAMDLFRDYYKKDDSCDGE